MAYQAPEMNSLIRTQYPSLKGQSGGGDEKREGGMSTSVFHDLCCSLLGCVSLTCKWLCHADLISKQKEGEENRNPNVKDGDKPLLSFACSLHGQGQKVAPTWQRAKTPTAVDHPNDQPSAPCPFPTGDSSST